VQYKGSTNPCRRSDDLPKDQNAFNRQPQITINNGGIVTVGTPFYKWNELNNEKAIREGSGKYAVYYLCYDHPNGSTKFHLDDLEVNVRLLQKSLRLYRGRSDQAKL
jgi:hypothetical protein